MTKGAFPNRKPCHLSQRRAGWPGSLSAPPCVNHRGREGRRSNQRGFPATDVASHTELVKEIGVARFAALEERKKDCWCGVTHGRDENRLTRPGKKVVSPPPIYETTSWWLSG